MKSFIMRYLGDSYDYIPIAHPRNNRQVLFYDYKNFMGYGNTCLYLTSPCRHYYQLVSHSFTDWIQEQAQMLENNQLITMEDGAVTPRLNLDLLYADFIENTKYHGSINNLKMTKE